MIRVLGTQVSKRVRPQQQEGGCREAPELFGRQSPQNVVGEREWVGAEFKDDSLVSGLERCMASEATHAGDPQRLRNGKTAWGET